MIDSELEGRIANGVTTLSRCAEVIVVGVTSVMIAVLTIVLVVLTVAVVGVVSTAGVPPPELCSTILNANSQSSNQCKCHHCITAMGAKIVVEWAQIAAPDHCNCIYSSIELARIPARYNPIMYDS